jgi:hypothetical protein
MKQRRQTARITLRPGMKAGRKYKTDRIIVHPSFLLVCFIIGEGRGKEKMSSQTIMEKDIILQCVLW